MYVIRRPHSPVRLRRPVPRWRVIVRRVILSAAVLLFVALAFAQTVHGSQPGGYVTVAVRPGDTVWSIAAGRYPGADTREKVDEILAANGLRQPSLHPGQTLRVPAA